MSDEKLDEFERQIHDAIRFHREQYEKAIAPLIEKLKQIQSLRPRVFYVKTASTLGKAPALTGDPAP
jgi:hypothetical protein